MKKNRIRICGRNTSTPPTPAITPSTSRLRSGPSAMRAVVCSASQAMPSLMASMGRLAHENTAWKIRNSSVASSTRPHTGCITTASMRWSKRSKCKAPGAATARMRRTSRCSSAVPGAGMAAAGSAAGAEAAPNCSACRSISARSAACPLCRTATVSTTGTPSSADSLATSICKPRERATSAMFSDTIIGRPSAFSSSTSRRFMRRFVASTTATMASGADSPSRRPNTTSRVTSSSGVSGVRL